MRIKVLEYYGRKAVFDSWVIGFIYRNEKVMTIVMMEDGTLSDENIEDIKVDIKGE